MREEIWRYLCLTCGHGGAGPAEQQYGCSSCKTTLKMVRASNNSAYPLEHGGSFNKDCDCEQCSVFWRKDNTVSATWLHDECTLSGKSASKIFDIFAGSDPVAVFVATRVLGWPNSTVTLKQWVQRIRDLGGNSRNTPPLVLGWKLACRYHLNLRN